MTVRYDSLKTMRSAKIGSIMPWGGDGGNGFLASNIPKGWIVCTGQTLNASDYPLLAASLGDTYGGDMTDAGGDHPEFPYYGTTATFRLPQLSSTVMVDLERQYLDDPVYQMGQDDPANAIYDEQGSKLGDLISGFGEDQLINSTYQASADIDFTLNLAGNLYFKFDNITLTAPDFLETVHTLNRKLGINHMPSHGHSDSLGSANPNASGPMVFRTDRGIEMTGEASTGICNQTEGPNTCQNAEAEPTSWQNGAVSMTMYGDGFHEHTLPRCDNFMEFIQDSTGKNYWGNVPAGASNWPTTDREQANGGTGPVNTTYTQTIFGRQATEQIIDTEPVDTHKQPCHTGYFPRPMEVRQRPNFLGYDTGAAVRGDGLVDDPELAPVFSVSGVTLTSDSSSFTLPAGTDIRRLYSVGAENWYQYDKITPLMYVTAVSVDNKYHVFREGTIVQQIENTGTIAAPVYEITLNLPVKNGGTVDVQFRHGSYPMTMNLAGTSKDPTEQTFRSHNHGSFEINQTIGSMSSPPSHTAADADGSSLTADSLENALNITCDTTQPSLTMTFIIKAY